MFLLKLRFFKWLKKVVHIFRIWSSWRRTEMLWDKNVSRDVHKVSQFSLHQRAYVLFSGSPEIQVNHTLFRKLNLGMGKHRAFAMLNGSYLANMFWNLRHFLIRVSTVHLVHLRQKWVHLLAYIQVIVWNYRPCFSVKHLKKFSTQLDIFYCTVQTLEMLSWLLGYFELWYPAHITWSWRWERNSRGKG